MNLRRLIRRARLRATISAIEGQMLDEQVIACGHAARMAAYRDDLYRLRRELAELGGMDGERLAAVGDRVVMTLVAGIIFGLLLAAINGAFS